MVDKICIDAMSGYVNAFVLKEANNAIENLIIEHRDFINKESMTDIDNTMFYEGSILGIKQETEQGVAENRIEKEYELLKRVILYE